MKILVIKQTSLGDVLHASGHIRSIKQQYPESKLVLQTATSSSDIYTYNPNVDEIIPFDRYAFKRNWYRHPLESFQSLIGVIREIRKQEFDIAFDLQGLAKTMVFLYTARARKKYSKGNWLGVPGFRDKQLHAIEEMDGVLKLAGIDTNDTSMEFPTSGDERNKISAIFEEFNPNNLPVLVMSPFSRWQSKDWPLQNFIQVAALVNHKYFVVFTGAEERAAEIDELIQATQLENVISVAGKLNLLEFVELVSQGDLMLTGDSFPMHVASAKKTPVVALFGPTDESKVGPLGRNDKVIRVQDCDKCDRRDCPRLCLTRLKSGTVVKQILHSK